MSWIPLVSILIRLTAVVWSVVLLRRLRDWRLGFFTVIFVLMAVRQIWLVRSVDSLTPVARMAELSSLALSLLAFMGLLIIERVLMDRKRTEDTLRASKTKFSTAFRSSPDTFMISSIPEGRIVEVNEGITRVLGFARQEVLGKTVRELKIWGDLADRDRMMEILKRDGRVHRMECLFRTRPGSLKTGQLSAELIDLDGKPHLLAVVRDVTDLKRAEEERARFIEELESKNAELERFTYTVSHDLRTPLVTIRGFLGYLQRDIAAGDAERTRDDMEKILTATETMKQLLDELLELSRVGRKDNPPEDVALAVLAREAAAMVAARIEERGIAVEIDPELPVVVGDRPRLFEVFLNLIENAVKFMGGQPTPQIAIGQRSQDGETVIFVRDNGAGIDSRYHEKVFGLFDRLDPTIPGTGIGLALVKRIVEIHGGRIWVESVGEGRGSTFCFTLGESESGDSDSNPPP